VGARAPSAKTAHQKHRQAINVKNKPIVRRHHIKRRDIDRAKHHPRHKHLNALLRSHWHGIANNAEHIFIMALAAPLVAAASAIIAGNNIFGVNVISWQRAWRNSRRAFVGV